MPPTFCSKSEGFHDINISFPVGAIGEFRVVLILRNIIERRDFGSQGTSNIQFQMVLWSSTSHVFMSMIVVSDEYKIAISIDRMEMGSKLRCEKVQSLLIKLLQFFSISVPLQLNLSVSCIESMYCPVLTNYRSTSTVRYPQTPGLCFQCSQNQWSRDLKFLFFPLLSVQCFWNGPEPF